MTRQEKYPDTATFHFHNENPKGKFTTDCVYRAIATATGEAYATVVREMAELHIRTGLDTHEKRTIDKYLTSKGFTKYKQPRKPDNTKYTGKEFCEQEQLYNPGRRIVANIGGHHIVAILDGKVWDTWDSTRGCIGNYWIKE